MSVKSRYFIKLIKTDWDMPDIPVERRQETLLDDRELTKEEFDIIYNALHPK